jgi:hypothetical protein
MIRFTSVLSYDVKHSVNLVWSNFLQMQWRERDGFNWKKCGLHLAGIESYRNCGNSQAAAVEKFDLVTGAWRLCDHRCCQSLWVHRRPAIG